MTTIDGHFLSLDPYNNTDADIDTFAPLMIYRNWDQAIWTRRSFQVEFFIVTQA